MGQKRINAFYKSDEWKELCKEILSNTSRCQLCGDDKSKLFCSHINPIGDNWDHRLDKTNIEVLCEDCHTGKKFFESSRNK